MSDHDLIRRGDALAVIDALKAEFEAGGSPTAAMVLDLAREALAALPTAKQDDLASSKAVTVSAADLLKDVPRYNGWNDCNPAPVMYEADVLAALKGADHE